MEEAAVWQALPKEEHRSVWQDTEQRFWDGFTRDNDAQDQSAEWAFQNQTNPVQAELQGLARQREELSGTHARLVAHLAEVEADLARVTALCEGHVEKLSAVERRHREEMQGRMETREKVQLSMTNFFREKRGEKPLSQLPAEANGVNGANGTNGTNPVNRDNDPRRQDREAHPAVPLNGADHSKERPPAPTHATPVDSLVNVVDVDMNVIGPVERIEPWNQWVEGIQELAIQRPVMIRRGRRFSAEHLVGIYERAEAKGVKWLACMVQATGRVQSKRCISCDKNQGAFEQCVIVGGDLFQKCGNCEWNRQGCHGASNEYIDLSAAKRLGQEQAEEKREAQRRTREKKGWLDTVQGPVSEPVRGPREEPAWRKPAEENLGRHEDPRSHPRQEPRPLEPAPMRRSALPTSRPPPGARTGPPEEERIAQLAYAQIARHAQGAPPPERIWPSTEMVGVHSEYRVNGDGQRHSSHGMHSQPPQVLAPGEPKELTIVSGFTPANARSRPPSHEVITPPALSSEVSPQPSATSEPLEEITRENLVLRDDGVVFTQPECMVGVPLVKIDENHPYWDPSWKDIRTEVTRQREVWQEKHQAAIEADARGERAGSSKYQIGRQVNRGAKILEFLDDGELSPYQLLGKSYLHSAKGGITSYDTLFRLAETLSELTKFNLDVKPAEWIRHRLHEISIAQGDRFNMPRVIHDFYHDPKLAALRSKHGFRNIGRPSGMGPKGNGSRNSTPHPPSRKRKSAPTMLDTPRDTPRSTPKEAFLDTPQTTPREAVFINQSPLAMPVGVPLEPNGVIHLPKRPRHTNFPPPPAHGEPAHAADFTDTDSWSGASLGPRDFRIYQIKSRLYTSSTKVTQYWTWVPEERYLEHQVLKDVRPPAWGVHREPIDFSVKLGEVGEIAFSLEALRAHLVMRSANTTIARKDGMPRGDLMVGFKRERTLTRFLAFCREMGVYTYKVLPEQIDRQWMDMHSERLPDNGGTASAELLE